MAAAGAIGMDSDRSKYRNPDMPEGYVRGNPRLEYKIGIEIDGVHYIWAPYLHEANVEAREDYATLSDLITSGEESSIEDTVEENDTAAAYGVWLDANRYYEAEKRYYEERSLAGLSSEVRKRANPGPPPSKPSFHNSDVGVEFSQPSSIISKLEKFENEQATMKNPTKSAEKPNDVADPSKYQEKPDPSYRYLYTVQGTSKYTAEDDGELSFSVGDFIEVIACDDPEERAEGWLMGVLHGKKGLFPVSFTSRI